MSTDKLPQNYDDLKETLDKLFEDWKEAIKKLFITDGALPGYCDQKLKILYLAREMHTTEGLKDNPEKRNIVEFVDAFLSGRRDSSNPSSEAYAVKQITADGNKLLCWKIAACIAYNVHQCGKKPWTEPPFEELQSAYNNNKNGFSFAILEASKYNNIVKSKKAPGISSVFEKYAYKSLGFIRREIDIIDPDLIISWNLKGAFKRDEDGKGKDKNGKKNNGDCFLRKLTGSKSPKKGSSRNVRIWTYKPSKGREIPLLDTWHFSNQYKNNNEKNRARYYYNPLRNAVKKLIEQGKLKERKN